MRQAVYGYRGRAPRGGAATARTALDAAGVAFDVDVATIALDPDQERTLSLGLREAVTNVIRHARRGRCRVTLIEDSHGIRLTVEDDGVGGDPAEGAGLSGMRARLAEIGGTMERDASARHAADARRPAAAGRRAAMVAS